jgi:predicted SAM-dependent methyltransferase
MVIDESINMKTININNPNAESQVAEVQSIVREYITEDMNGLDIGSGGNPVFIGSVSIDYNKPGHLGELVQLKGDAACLYWFKNEVFDYVFSSHCFEDFTSEDKNDVLKEWLRVIKPNGFLILVLPDEHLYVKFCSDHGTLNNPSHKDPDFSINTVRCLARDIRTLKEIRGQAVGAYSFILVYKKVWLAI